MNAKKSDRCPWCVSSELYIDYHDNEWGVPCYDNRALFEMLNLEGAQAGLSWITILNKRENYRRLFANFEVAKVARFTEKKIDKLVLDAGIVRHRQKIAAVVNNAKVVQSMQKEGDSFAEFVWSFVHYKPVQNSHKTLKTVPGSTDESLQMSKALKKRGFKFVGSTTCYAFMQASGMVNDHLVNCPEYKRVASLAKKPSPFQRIVNSAAATAKAAPKKAASKKKTAAKRSVRKTRA